jgi:hypothetical protein
MLEERNEIVGQPTISTTSDAETVGRPTVSLSDLTDTDIKALKRCLQPQRKRDANCRQQIDQMLKERDWLEVAMFASYCVQMHALRLRPFEAPPCWAPDHGPCAPLLERMLRHGFSQFEPDMQAVIVALNQIERPMHRPRNKNER